MTALSPSSNVSAQGTEIIMTERTFRPAALPSKGLPYGDKIPGGKMEVYSIRAKDAKLVLGSGVKALDMLNMLLKACIKSPAGIEPDELTSTDRMYLLLLLRILSYGKDYTFPVDCPSCGLAAQHKIDLNSFSTRELPDDFVEPFTLVLPMSEKTVGLRLLRVSDEREIEKQVEDAYKRGPQLGDSSAIYQVCRQVVSVDGQPISGRDRLEFVEELIGRDFDAIRNRVAAVDSGVETEMEVVCARCSRKRILYLPFGPGFFRSDE